MRSIMYLNCLKASGSCIVWKKRVMLGSISLIISVFAGFLLSRTLADPQNGSQNTSHCSGNSCFRKFSMGPLPPI